MRRGRYFPQELKDAQARAALAIKHMNETPTFQRTLRLIEQLFDVSEPTARDLIRRGQELRRSDRFGRFRQRIDEAIAHAERCTDDEQRRVWLAIAETWKQATVYLGVNARSVECDTFDEMRQETRQ